MGVALAFGPCWTCGGPFWFDPERVVSIPIDPGTGQPPDLGGTDPAHAIRRPLCPECVRRINVYRRERGEAPIDETDTAAALFERHAEGADVR